MLETGAAAGLALAAFGNYLGRTPSARGGSYNTSGSSAPVAAQRNAPRNPEIQALSQAV